MSDRIGCARCRLDDIDPNRTTSRPFDMGGDEFRSMNHLKTFVLLAALTALFVGAGYLVGGPTGMAIAFVLAAGMNLVSYWNADKIVLRMYGAQPVDESHPNALV